MRRLSITFVLLPLIVGGLFIYNRTRQDRWRPLPGGGEIRCLGVTPNAYLSVSRSRFEPLRRWLSPRWVHLLGPPPYTVWATLPESQPIFWFQIRNDNAKEEQPGYFLLIQNDKPVLCTSVTEAKREDQKFVGLGFDSVSRRQSRLHIRWSKDNHVEDFDIANPFHSQAKNP